MDNFIPVRVVGVFCYGLSTGRIFVYSCFIGVFGLSTVSPGATTTTKDIFPALMLTSAVDKTWISLDFSDFLIRTGLRLN